MNKYAENICKEFNTSILVERNRFQYLETEKIFLNKGDMEAPIGKKKQSEKSKV